MSTLELDVVNKLLGKREYRISDLEKENRELKANLAIAVDAMENASTYYERAWDYNEHFDGIDIALKKIKEKE